MVALLRFSTWLQFIMPVRQCLRNADLTCSSSATPLFLSTFIHSHFYIGIKTRLATRAHLHRCERLSAGTGQLVNSFWAGMGRNGFADRIVCSVMCNFSLVIMWCVMEIVLDYSKRLWCRKYRNTSRCGKCLSRNIHSNFP